MRSKQSKGDTGRLTLGTACCSGKVIHECLIIRLIRVCVICLGIGAFAAGATSWMEGHDIVEHGSRELSPVDGFTEPLELRNVVFYVTAQRKVLYDWSLKLSFAFGISTVIGVVALNAWDRCNESEC